MRLFLRILQLYSLTSRSSIDFIECKYSQIVHHHLILGSNLHKDAVEYSSTDASLEGPYPAYSAQCYTLPFK